MKNNLGMSYVCPVCKELFTTRQGAKIHISGIARSEVLEELKDKPHLVFLKQHRIRKRANYQPRISDTLIERIGIERIK